jgi:type III pantothenate kinase
MRTLLAVDVGNSSVTSGIFTDDRLLGRFDIPSRGTGTESRYREEIGAFLGTHGIRKPLDGVMLSSVVPEMTVAFVGALREMSGREPLVLAHSLSTGLTFDLERPEEIGPDRIANAVAALDAVGSPVAVVDFGTATTVSAVRNSRFLGGAILPGIRLMGEALHGGTAKLPAVDFTEKTNGSVSSVAALGKSTTACIISGMIYGTAGAVERIIRGIETEEGCAFKVVATGGYSSVTVSYMERGCSLDPDLTLKGMRLIYGKNA